MTNDSAPSYVQAVDRAWAELGFLDVSAPGQGIEVKVASLCQQLGCARSRPRCLLACQLRGAVGGLPLLSAAAAAGSIVVRSLWERRAEQPFRPRIDRDGL